MKKQVKLLRFALYWAYYWGFILSLVGQQTCLQKPVQVRGPAIWHSVAAFVRQFGSVSRSRCPHRQRSGFGYSEVRV